VITTEWLPLVVILNVRSSQGGVNRLRDGFEELCAVIAQDLLRGVGHRGNQP